ncbi:WVD2-like protein 2 isoform X1 [Tanacetum coccineum]
MLKASSFDKKALLSQIGVMFNLTLFPQVMGTDTDDDEKMDRARQLGTTVGVAPSFRSAERAEKRREFYKKLEEKQQAQEAEKMENEMRTKEEEEAAIKELRKNLYVKAHPVPSFYKEGPPPKFEPKKIPLTRAKSPKLTRGRSCSGAHGSPAEDKCSPSRRARRSITPNSVSNK